MIQYTTNLPNKVDYYDLLKSVYEDVDVSSLSTELENSIACVCVYNGERLVGMGRVKRESNYLCIEDLIVKLEHSKEEIQNNIIVGLFDQLNQIKNYDIAVRDCLSMKMSNEEVIYSKAMQEQNYEKSTVVSSQLQLNGLAGV